MENKTVELVNRWHEYQQKHSNASLTDFFRYSLQVEEQHFPLPEENHYNNIPTLDARLSRCMGRVIRFQSMYARKALAEVDFKNLDDFLYLNTISRMDNPKKSEVIYENVSEFSSGTEIIKRLVQLGLVEESADAEDRRSKRLTITAQGKTILLKCYEKMQAVSAMSLSVLSTDDKELLFSLLLPVDLLHTSLYEQIRNKNIDEISKEIEARVKA
jgi:DNA-binding MarR family transcriptional regulator